MGNTKHWGQTKLRRIAILFTKTFLKIKKIFKSE